MFQYNNLLANTKPKFGGIIYNSYVNFMNVYLYIIFFNFVIQCYSYHTCVHIPYIIKLHVTTDTLADKYLGTP